MKGFQAGLSCLIVLQKRPALRRAFGAFDPDHVAALTDDDLHVIGQDREVIRNRAKVAAARTNAEATIALRRHGGLEELVWSRRGVVGTDPDDPRQARAAGELARDLRADGFRFVGPTSAHAFLQAAGVLPAHVPGMSRRRLLGRPGRHRGGVAPTGGSGRRSAGRRPDRPDQHPSPGSRPHGAASLGDDTTSGLLGSRCVSNRRPLRRGHAR
ncbi:DNA-3-methyladenine glycosylase I [Iamia sp. SCSIO 61187]|nr:DNA-3-methyladenine glycosylase I [Iamia sp. SCSIO 61187]